MAPAMDSLPSYSKRIVCTVSCLDVTFAHRVNRVPCYCCALCFDISPSELPYHLIGIAMALCGRTVEQSSLFNFHLGMELKFFRILLYLWV